MVGGLGIMLSEEMGSWVICMGWRRRRCKCDRQEEGASKGRGTSVNDLQSKSRGDLSRTVGHRLGRSVDKVQGRTWWVKYFNVLAGEMSGVA